MRKKKLRHNKKRNTAFLYECLIRELTSSIIEKDKKKQKKIQECVKFFFRKDTFLSRELDCYRSIYETRNSSFKNSEKIIKEAKDKRDKTIDEKELFNEQTKLIDYINKNIGKKVFNSFVPNYKTLASISQIFNRETAIKDKVLLENSLIRDMNEKEEVLKEEKKLEPLSYKLFVEKFNSKYGDSLLNEQRDLIKSYLFSFSDNGASLVEFMENELGRIHHNLSEAKKHEKNDLIREKLGKVEELIKQNNIQNEEFLISVLKVQKLVSEYAKNENKN